MGLSHLGATGLELLLGDREKCLLVLVDSGASLSLMKTGISSSELQPTQTATRGITGNKLKATGTQHITIRLGRTTFKREFLTVPLDVECSGIFSCGCS